jgi:hypothetical protein
VKGILLNLSLNCDTTNKQAQLADRLDGEFETEEEEEL